MMIRLCIFDMDGLLIDSERLMWTESMRIAAKEQGHTMSDEFHHTFMGRNLNSVGDILRKEYGPEFDYDIFLKRCYEINDTILSKGIPLMKGAKQLLDYLKESGIYTCIGTTTHRRQTTALLTANKMLEDFDDIVCGDEVSIGKPNPEIYLKCLSKFKDVDKSEALVFEDGNAGAHAGIDSGMRLVLVPDLAYLDDEVRSKAYKIIPDLSKAIDFIKEENERTTSI